MDNRRSHQRYACSISAKVHSKFGSFACSVTDISATGLGASHDHLVRLDKGENVRLELPSLGTRSVEVMWTGSGKFGVRFKQLIGEEEIRKLVALVS